MVQLAPRAVLRFASGLRFPQLFLLALGLFVVDVLVPDFVPFADEIILGLVTLIAASLRKQVQPPQGRVFDNEGSQQ
ncbi:MAG: hypothetical protein NFCOHLIN_01292 [Gammaproteobacteria bacterium]|nr:hypothetical protein [Gammaproteobacteria bacterium]